MSGSLNIYPFQDTETTIRFVVQVSLFLIGLVITNKFIIRPALKLQLERTKRTTGNQIVAQQQNKHAENLEHTYLENFNKAIEEVYALRDNQIKQTKENANRVILNAQQKSAEYIGEIKNSLSLEKEKAVSQIYMHIDNIVNSINAKFGIQT